MGPSDYEWVPYSVTIGSAWAHEGERIGPLKSVELGRRFRIISVQGLDSRSVVRIPRPLQP